MQTSFIYDRTPRFVYSPYRCTGKERDTEFGLDYFGARYYASNMGRWMSPDWSAKAEPVPYAKLDDPQSLNLYGYVGNNPLSRADANGHCFWDLCVGETAGVIYLATAATAAVIAAEVFLHSPQGQAAIASIGSSLFLAQSSSASSTATVAAAGAAAASPNPNGNKDKGTKKRGQKSSRSTFRKATVQDAWNNAADGPSEGKLCPTWANEVFSEPGSGTPRDWDINHDPIWSVRELSDTATRADWINLYQEGTELECPVCNRGNNQIPTPAPTPTPEPAPAPTPTPPPQ